MINSQVNLTIVPTTFFEHGHWAGGPQKKKLRKRTRSPDRTRSEGRSGLLIEVIPYKNLDDFHAKHKNKFHSAVKFTE